MIYTLWGVIMLCLAYACITDVKTCLVYNVTWWIAGASACLLYPVGAKLPGKEQLIELIIFLILQWKLFSGWYGKADCYAFSVCAVAGGSLGFGLLEYLIHMLGAFAILALVQGMRRNINRRGNLKHPVPFLPYITLAFWGMLWYHNSC